MEKEKKKIRLLLTASTFPRWKDDTEPRFILDLAKAYTKYFDVTVLAPMTPGASTREELERVHVIRYHYFPIHKFETLCYPGAIVPRIKEKKTRALLVPFFFLGLKRALRKTIGNYDFIHAHWIIPQGIIQYRFKKPYILTGHGADVTSLNQFSLLRSMKKKAIGRASKYIVVSRALAEYSKDTFNCDYPQVISMGCDLTAFSSSYRIENYYDQGEKPVVLFVGRLAEKKGVTYLIDAVDGLDLKLVIVGTGPLEEDLKKQAAPQGDRITFLGAKSHEELKTIYASADVFVAPSITASDGDKEGLGLVLLEAMASGIPVIGSCSGGIPEIVFDGKNGFLVPEKDVSALKASIKKLIEDPALRAEMAKAGAAIAKERDYSVISYKYAKMISESFFEEEKSNE